MARTRVKTKAEKYICRHSLDAKRDAVWFHGKLDSVSVSCRIIEIPDTIAKCVRKRETVSIIGFVEFMQSIAAPVVMPFGIQDSLHIRYSMRFE